MRASGKHLVLAAALITACGTRDSAFSSANSPAAHRLAGSWVIRMRLERLRFEQIAQSEAAAREVHGTVALVANHWLESGTRPYPSNYGSYDIDFRGLGFDPRASGRAPRLEAQVHGRDSVDIILEPDANEHLHLRGSWISDSIVGHWSLEAERTGGDAAGSFALTRQHSP